LGQTFPLTNFIEFLSKKSPNLMELGLTFNPNELPFKRISIDPLIDNCQKFSRLSLNYLTSVQE